MRMCSRNISRLFEQPAVHLFFIAAVIFLGVGVRLSDCASVQRIQVGAAEDYGRTVNGKSALSIFEQGRDINLEESLAAASKTHQLNDTLSPSSNSAIRNGAVLQSLLSVSLKPKKGLAANSNEMLIRSSTGSERALDEDNATLRSSLVIAQCRATCLQKFLLRTGATQISFQEQTTSSPKQLDKDIKHQFSPNLLRFKRASGVNKSLSSSSFCLQNSSDCLSCWKSCQVLDANMFFSRISPSGATSNKPEAVYPSSEATTPSSSSLTLSAATGDDATTTADTAAVALMLAAGEEISGGGGGERETNGKVMVKSKQPILACSENGNNSSSNVKKHQQHHKNCIGGCQVACLFYERIASKNGQGRLNARTSSKEAVAAAAMNESSSVKILPGKITWPAITFVAKNDNASNSTDVFPVVYVVIQEYPDRKWRQITQTTELELGIPFELTTATREKLRYIRVLAVSPDGLQTVYNSLGKTPPTKTSQKQVPLFADRESDKLAKVDGVPVEEEQVEKMRLSTTTVTATNIATEAIPITTLTTEANNVGVVNVEQGSSNIDGYFITQQQQQESQIEQGTDITAVETETESPSISMSAEESFGGLRLVSLIRQNSLVIAEMRWNQSGDNIIEHQQDYLVTWEVTGGGLKGHLVTDSTSVTLSLWPDTSYRVQVERFQQNLDFDGEQVLAEDSSPSRKSLILIVDTSMASFPVARASALLGGKDTVDIDYEQDEDEFVAEDEETEGVEEEEGSTSQRKTLGQVLGVALASLVVVLAILSLVAFLLVKLRMISAKRSCMSGGGPENKASDCLSCCLTSVSIQQNRSNRLLGSQDNLSFEETTFPFRSSPMDYVLSQKQKQYKNKTTFKCSDKTQCFIARSSPIQIDMSGDDQDDEFQHPVFSTLPPVAMISSTTILSDESSSQENDVPELKGASCSLFDSYFSINNNNMLQEPNLTSRGSSS